MAEATRQIQVRAVSSPIGGYRLNVINAQKVREGAIIARMAQISSKEPAQVRYWLDILRQAMLAELAQNHVVNLGFASARLIVRGSLKSANDQPTPENNPIAVSMNFLGDIAEVVRAYEVVNCTLTVPAVMHELMQNGASGRNRIESTSATIVINGERIEIDPNAPDEGIWLEHTVSGTKVATATVTVSTHTGAEFTFGTLPATGQYQLVLATRDGENPEEYAPKRLTRKVFVKNGGAE